MELTPERKQQIEEEERQRLAEEQYRAQVRAGLSPAPSQTVPAAPERRKSRVGLLLVILAVAVIGAVIMMFRPNRYNPAFGGSPQSSSGSPYSPSVRNVPVTQTIASGQVTVKARGYVQYPIQITPEMRGARVVGHFNASGGSGNDVGAVIANEDEFANWINGHEARVFYTTRGKETNGSFDVRLGPGTYILGISNRFALLSDKYVFLEVDLKYSKLETY